MPLPSNIRPIICPSNRASNPENESSVWFFQTAIATAVVTPSHVSKCVRAGYFGTQASSRSRKGSAFRLLWGRSRSLPFPFLADARFSVEGSHDARRPIEIRIGSCESKQVKPSFGVGVLRGLPASLDLFLDSFLEQLIDNPFQFLLRGVLGSN